MVLFVLALGQTNLEKVQSLMLQLIIHAVLIKTKNVLINVVIIILVLLDNEFMTIWQDQRLRLQKHTISVFVRILENVMMVIKTVIVELALKEYLNKVAPVKSKSKTTKNDQKIIPKIFTMKGIILFFS